METPEGQLAVGCSERKQVVRRSSGWLSCTVQIGRQQPAVGRTHIETLLRGRLSRKHAGSVVSTDFAAEKGVTVEVVECCVIGVGPHTYLGVIRKARVGERVAVPGAGWIGCHGDSHAL